MEFGFLHGIIISSHLRRMQSQGRMGMGKRQRQRQMVLVLCFCFLLSSMLAIAFLATYVDHPCVGDGCEICLQMTTAERLLKQLKTITIVLLIFIVQFVFSMHLSHQRYFFFPTLISLKVRLDH